MLLPNKMVFWGLCISNMHPGHLVNKQDKTQLSQVDSATEHVSGTVIIVLNYY